MSKVFVELLRGRDGLPGPAGPPGKDCKQGKEIPSGSLNGVVTYTRWGARSCPNSIDLVYTGIAGGNIYITKEEELIFCACPWTQSMNYLTFLEFVGIQQLAQSDIIIP